MMLCESTSLGWRRRLETVRALMVSGLCLLALLSCQGGITSKIPVVNRCKMPALQEALKEGADVNQMDEDGLTPLMLAAQKGCTKVVKVLLDKNPRINMQSDVGWSALYYAVAHERRKAAETLLDGGADAVHLVDHKKRTVLMIAAEQGDQAVLETRLRREPPLDALDANGDTALSYAVREGNVKATKAMLEAGASVDTASEGNFTVLMTAVNHGQTKVVKLLIDQGADVNAVYNRNRSVLMMAANRGHLRITRLLLEHGADTNATDRKGMTACLIAEKVGHDNIVELLAEVEEGGCIRLMPFT
ncbi:hypothetical protein C2W62_41030 [Candidatus Entotheonella serta]|nr:hypothetical protein C2W62_41030 [Candidatus Entotheonella serta]